ncbi:MAG: class III signal peptide-containing protein [Candidatus Omnitrophica bacterium]|nr:class III signal peptide-containing protein [Candidatus Omnitrophota bacterium]
MLKEKKKVKKGQSTLEYIILMTAVVIAIIAFVGSNSSPFRTALNSTLTSSTNTMNEMGGKIGTTFAGADETAATATE